MSTAQGFITPDRAFTDETPMAALKFSGENLQSRRRAAGYSRRQLGDRIGKGQLTISAYEQNRYTPSTTAIARLAAVLGCRIDDLFSGEAPPDAT
jgi:putative transcriptional regulator